MLAKGSVGILGAKARVPIEHSDWFP